MTNQEIEALLEKQRTYYRSGATIPVKFRMEQLKKLYNTIKKYGNEINDALTADLGKSRYEGFMCESGLVLTEISYMIKYTKKFARRKTVPSPLAQFHLSLPLRLFFSNFLFISKCLSMNECVLH